eukprot:1621643-Rhodomonas_salina.5
MASFWGQVASLCYCPSAFATRFPALNASFAAVHSPSVTLSRMAIAVSFPLSTQPPAVRDPALMYAMLRPDAETPRAGDEEGRGSNSKSSRETLLRYDPER